MAVDWDCAHKALEASKGIGLQPKQQGEEEPRCGVKLCAAAGYAWRGVAVCKSSIKTQQGPAQQSFGGDQLKGAGMIAGYEKSLEVARSI